jgi:hypothetical protein
MSTCKMTNRKSKSVGDYLGKITGTLMLLKQ